MNRPSMATLVSMAALVGLAGCGSAAGGTGTSSAAGGAAASSSAATLTSATVSGHGTVVVAGANSMTVYQFAHDTAGSGVSACMDSCAGTWPPVTVAGGVTPTAASGLTGSLGTLNRSDGRGTQVTYNGRPLYFFSGDTTVGDANGNYPGWSVVSMSAGSSAGAATPTPSAAYGGYAYP